MNSKFNLPDGCSARDCEGPEMVECDCCNGTCKDARYNDCCGVEYDTDVEMCPSCHEHCGPSDCDKCSATGLIRKDEAD